jgi:hypothetical protein
MLYITRNVFIICFKTVILVGQRSLGWSVGEFVLGEIV